jgi:hypothetical protein
MALASCSLLGHNRASEAANSASEEHLVLTHCPFPFRIITTGRANQAPIRSSEKSVLVMSASG